MAAIGAKGLSDAQQRIVGSLSIASFRQEKPPPRWFWSEQLCLQGRTVLHSYRCMHARRRGRVFRRGAEGATAPETLRQKDRGR